MHGWAHIRELPLTIVHACLLDVALECAGFLQGLGYPTSVMIRSRPLKGFDKVSAFYPSCRRSLYEG